MQKREARCCTLGDRKICSIMETPQKEAATAPERSPCSSSLTRRGLARRGGATRGAGGAAGGLSAPPRPPCTDFSRLHRRSTSRSSSTQSQRGAAARGRRPRRRRRARGNIMSDSKIRSPTSPLETNICGPRRAAVGRLSPHPAAHSGRGGKGNCRRVVRPGRARGVHRRVRVPSDGEQPRRRDESHAAFLARRGDRGGACGDRRRDGGRVGEQGARIGAEADARGLGVPRLGRAQGAQGLEGQGRAGGGLCREDGRRRVHPRLPLQVGADVRQARAGGGGTERRPPRSRAHDACVPCPLGQVVSTRTDVLEKEYIEVRGDTSITCPRHA